MYICVFIGETYSTTDHNSMPPSQCLHACAIRMQTELINVSMKIKQHTPTRKANIKECSKNWAESIAAIAQLVIYHAQTVSPASVGPDRCPAAMAAWGAEGLGPWPWLHIARGAGAPAVAGPHRRLRLKHHRRFRREHPQLLAYLLAID